MLSLLVVLQCAAAGVLFLLSVVPILVAVSVVLSVLMLSAGEFCYRCRWPAKIGFAEGLAWKVAAPPAALVVAAVAPVVCLLQQHSPSQFHRGHMYPPNSCHTVRPAS